MRQHVLLVMCKSFIPLRFSCNSTVVEENSTYNIPRFMFILQENAEEVDLSRIQELAVALFLLSRQRPLTFDSMVRVAYTVFDEDGDGELDKDEVILLSTMTMLMMFGLWWWSWWWDSGRGVLDVRLFVPAGRMCRGHLSVGYELCHGRTSWSQTCAKIRLLSPAQKLRRQSD